MVKLPEDLNINNLIKDLKVLSWEVADILLNYSYKINDANFEPNKILTNKDEKDPITLADLEVNDLILNRLKANYPGMSWQYLSEENVKSNSTICNLDSDWIWILDPLDGTKDFIQGTGNYAMHLALNYKNKPFLSIVLLPEKDELWIANNHGVWLEKRNGLITEIKLYGSKSLNEMTLVTSKNHNNAILQKLIAKINFAKIEIMGSIGCKIASILRGDSDIYICLSLPGKSSPKDWDFSAPEGILKAAGGAITNINNEELSYGKYNFEQEGIIVASNNYSKHESICSEIKKIIKQNDLYPI